MRVHDGMTEVLVTVGPGHTLRQAAQAMTARGVGAAVVVDPDGQGPALITERDILRAVAAGADAESEPVDGYQSSDLVFAAPEWSLERAADAMVRGRFRHLVVLDGGDLVGILSMRDIVRAWTTHGAVSELSAGAAG